MSKLTYCDGEFFSGKKSYQVVPKINISVKDCIDKLGQIEDLMEKYEINDLVDLEIALVYYNHRYDGGVYTERI